MRRPVPIRMTPQTAEARTRAIAKLAVRETQRRALVLGRLGGPDVWPPRVQLETIGHALQRAASENA